MTNKKSNDGDTWSTTAKVGAAVGSAALVAALIYKELIIWLYL